MVLEVHQQVAGLLDHPFTRGVGGDPRQVHVSQFGIGTTIVMSGAFTQGLAGSGYGLL